MREASADDIQRYRTLTFDDLPYLVPEWVLQKSHFPADADYYLPQVEWQRENVCIRGINRDTHEVMIDCGFGRVYWVGEGDEAPLLQFVAYRPSELERARRRSERMKQVRHVS